MSNKNQLEKLRVSVDHDSAKNIGDRQKAETPKIGGVAEIYD